MIFIFPLPSCSHQIVWISTMGGVQTGSSTFLLMSSPFSVWFPFTKTSFFFSINNLLGHFWSDDALVFAGISELAGLGAQAAGPYIWPGFCMYVCSNTPFSQVIPVKTPWGLCSTLWYTLYLLNILFNTHIVALFVRLGSCSLTQHFTSSLISKHINELRSETWQRTFKLLGRTAARSFGSVSMSRRAVMCSDEIISDNAFHSFLIACV